MNVVNMTTNEPHVVEIMCTCPDPDSCATNDLVADRNNGWKEYFRLKASIEQAS